jgi:hypothetical protein
MSQKNWAHLPEFENPSSCDDYPSAQTSGQGLPKIFAGDSQLWVSGRQAAFKNCDGTLEQGHRFSAASQNN